MANNISFGGLPDIAENLNFNSNWELIGSKSISVTYANQTANYPMGSTLKRYGTICACGSFTIPLGNLNNRGYLLIGSNRTCRINLSDMISANETTKNFVLTRNAYSCTAYNGVNGTEEYGSYDGSSNTLVIRQYNTYSITIGGSDISYVSGNRGYIVVNVSLYGINSVDMQ